MAKEYPETHKKGLITIENMPDSNLLVGDLGVQIARNGRVWVCINGEAFLRFKPYTEEMLHEIEESIEEVKNNRKS